MKIEIKEVARHRNGVGGEPFHAILFEDEEHGSMVAIVYNKEHHVPMASV